MITSLDQRTTNLARFPVRLNLPAGEQQLVNDAAEAVRKEYRSSVRWKRLRCRKVEPLTGQPADTIFILEVGHSIEFDWTWEGARAFRPADPNTFTGDTDATDDFADVVSADDTSSRHAAWEGEIVEVDENNGRLFVHVNSPDQPPCRGTFFVRPFEFLAFLHSVFCQPGAADLRPLLASRLHAARGAVHPAASGPRSGLQEFEQMWGHSWAVLWGPPGCGKTTNAGRQVAACLEGDERVLIVSTTNKATDAAALAVGRVARAVSPRSLEEGRVLRIGKGADYHEYEADGLTALLRDTEADLLQQIGSLTRNLHKARTHEERAVLRRQVQELRRRMKDSAFNIFVSPDVKVVVATAFKAVALLSDPAIRSLALAGQAPFTTVVIDEAGLMSRAVVAGLSLLAARRVVVVGDAKQLAPISKMSRVLPTAQATWLASSCLTHLQHVGQLHPAVHLLREQHRMHPDVSRVVSHYQYEGALCDAPGVLARQSHLPPLLAGQPRAVWYVLDEDGLDLPSIRAERGPGNRSWLRPATAEVLAKFFSDPGVCEARGLFITPFKAQARAIAGYLAAEHLAGWSAGTVHGRQGIEADVVIFDTVNAGSCAWPYDEWKRLVNVGLSRAREFVLVLASRAEMNESYLRPLLDHLAPRVLKRSGRGVAWVEVPPLPVSPTTPPGGADPDLLGPQIARRKSLRPVMSKEQQRLCGLNMDGKPRLVRGVAGSGKTWVLAHWLQKTVQKLSDRPEARVWAVYANSALRRLIADTIEEAWRADGGSGRCPLERVQLRHVKDLLQDLFQEVGLGWPGDRWDYDAQAAEYLKHRPFEQVTPRCQAMFIDEAQDMGPNTLKLLTALVEPTDPMNPKARAVNIFYDDAQNIFGRPRPTWAEIGLGMLGRSTVMKESFRSTRPITEFALNVLYRLQPPVGDPDHKELLRLGLIEQVGSETGPWWRVRFSQVEGPPPSFCKYRSLDQQVQALGDQVVRWIIGDGVKPCDICILSNDHAFLNRVDEDIGPRLREINARIVRDPGHGEARAPNALVVSTLHAFKGYEAEVVVIGGVERFIAEKQILPNNLYVAMTRARSVLAIYAYDKKHASPEAQTILSTMHQCLDVLLDWPQVEQEISNLDDFEEVAGRLGADRRDWLASLWKSYLIQQEPITADDGEILAEPLFWFQVDDRVFACFGNEHPGPHARHKLEDNGIEVIQPGQEPPSSAEERERRGAERARREKERLKREAEAAEQKRQELADRERAERMEQWKQSGMPREWVLEHLDGWDHPTWAALANRVKATRYWPLKTDEMEAYLEGLRDELRAERDRKRAEHRARADEQKRAEEEVRKKAEDDGKQKNPLDPARSRLAGEKVAVKLPGDVRMTFAWCPPGSFLMGSKHVEAHSEDQPIHRVTLTTGFYMGIHPVTQAQWKAVMGTEPSHFKGSNRPVEHVSWDDSREFCKRLTAQLKGKVTVRLPSEAEWEYACRAGTTAEFHFGDLINPDLANYDGSETWNGSPKGNYWKRTTDVGSFPANRWGLFDMHGSVWEWCEDWLGEYGADSQTDPIQLERKVEDCRVVRGGSWIYGPDHCRAASRNGYGPGYRDRDVGCRVCFRLA